MQFKHLEDFVKCYRAKNRQTRKETDRFKCFDYEELNKRDKLNLDIFWLRDESLEDSENLPDPGVIALDIVHRTLEDGLDEKKPFVACRAALPLGAGQKPLLNF